MTAGARRRRDACRRFALGLPQAWEDEPWESDAVVKVGKKIFVFLGAPDSTKISVKLPVSADHALSLTCASATSYGLGRHGWVTLDVDGADAPDGDLLQEWVEESYRAVAPRTLVRRLDED